MKRTTSQSESGYALLSLLVAMTIGLVLLASSMSKPSAQFSGQRENEEEAFFRAHQISYAIQRYAEIKGGGNLAPQNLPTKLEDLTKAFAVATQMGIQEQHILRASALIDPLTGTEWKPVRLGDPKVREFARAYQQFLLEQQAQLMTAGAGAQAMAAAQQGAQMPPLLTFAAQAAGINLNDPNAKDDKEEEDGKTSTASGFSLDLDSDSRPIVGVMSSLKKPMIRNYYNIATYDKAIFIAGVAVPGNYPVPLGGGGAGGRGGMPVVGGEDPNAPGTAPRLTCPPGVVNRLCPPK